MARFVQSLLAFGLVALFSGTATAQSSGLDAESKGPYLWRVVIDVRPHPLLTPGFRDQLRRDLLAALQPGIGTLGTVEVVDLAALPRDRWDPLWQQFVDTGFSALDGSRDLNGSKTHFLRVSYRGGAFLLESRQYDGFTGLVSPLIRKQSARSADLVGRISGLMLDRDFGIAGTVEPIEGKTDEVKVRLRGGELGSTARFVQRGDIFAVAQIRKTNRPAPPPVRTATGRIIAPPPGSEPPQGYTGAAWAYTLLRVNDDPKDGACRCTVLTRLKTPFALSGGVAGYRCLRLATVKTSLAVRLVTSDGNDKGPLPVIEVKAGDDGFPSRDQLYFQEGLFRSPRPLSNIACVTVSDGGTRSEKFPVPLIGDEPITIRFNFDRKAEEKAVFERSCLALSNRVNEARTAQAACFEAVSRLIESRKNSEALARAKAGVEATTSADKGAIDELQQLKEQLEKSPAAAKLLSDLERTLQSLRQKNTELAAGVKGLEAVVLKENDPAAAARDVQAQALNARINLLLGGGDVDEAINALGQLATLLPENAEVRARQNRLKAEWKPKNEEHAKAREFLLKTWPSLTTLADFKDKLGDLKTNANICKQAGDRYAFRKLQTIFSGTVARVAELMAPLDPNSDADRKLLDDAKQIGPVLAAIEQEAQELLKKKEQ